jgi:hypothetical protein
VCAGVPHGKVENIGTAWEKDLKENWGPVKIVLMMLPTEVKMRLGTLLGVLMKEFTHKFKLNGFLKNMVARYGTKTS